jgi:YD repeat-containing protein
MNYDMAQRLTTAQDGPTLVTFTFDANGNQTSENRGGVITGFVFDRENRLKKLTNANLEVTTTTYDGDGLRRNKQWMDGSDDPPRLVVTTFLWDEEHCPPPRRGCLP